MLEKRGNWIWTVLRGKKRRELDRLQHELMYRPHEKRAFAGDPNQAPHMRLPLKQK